MEPQERIRIYAEEEGMTMIITGLPYIIFPAENIPTEAATQGAYWNLIFHLYRLMPPLLQPRLLYQEPVIHLQTQMPLTCKELPLHGIKQPLPGPINPLTQQPIRLHWQQAHLLPRIIP